MLEREGILLCVMVLGCVGASTNTTADMSYTRRSVSGSLNGTEDEIVFPTQRTTDFKPICENDHCRDVTNYPDETVINSILVRAPVNIQSFFNEKQPTPQETWEEYEPVCKTNYTLEPLRVVHSTAKQYHMVPQSKQFQQLVLRGVCARPDGAACDQSLFPLGYVTQCRQEYHHHRMVVLDRKGSLIIVSVRVQSGCACYYMKPKPAMEWKQSGRL